ncbi:MAG TPA: hydrogenase expression/formation protein HypE [Lachnospiraceae bacterium]|nr:hydrogenase expression/formation protein HypE [Lachnospiraceae bacterium]
MIHGSGGAATRDLIEDVFAAAFDNSILSGMEDAAVIGMEDEAASGMELAVTTDSFVVTPVEFCGGDIGRLAVCGTVNDLLMRGATPKYITSAWILEVGVDTELLKRVVDSMARTAAEAGVSIVTGDTKVVEGSGGIYVNTTGVGFVKKGLDISASNAVPGDVIIVSGNLGDHHAAILGERMSIDTRIKSDVAPLVQMCEGLLNLRVHTLRDITRGGLGTVLNELADASDQMFEIYEDSLPVSDEVRGFCGLLGLDPMYMGNEGKLVCIVDPDDADEALSVIRASRYGEAAAVIGRVVEAEAKDRKTVIMRTGIGGRRVVDVLRGEGLPRIC